MRLTHLILAGALALGVPAAADAIPYELDKSHAQITFSVGHLGFSNVNGIFREFDAEIDFDEGRVEDTQVTVTIKAASVDTFWAERDKHIRNEDFLDVERYPEITFVSTRVVPTGADTADLIGNLTMLGQTREVTFQAKLNKIGPSPFDANKKIAGFTVTGQIDRTEFGMNFLVPAVSAVIPVEINLEMSPK